MGRRLVLTFFVFGKREGGCTRQLVVIVSCTIIIIDVYPNASTTQKRINRTTVYKRRHDLSSSKCLLGDLHVTTTGLESPFSKRVRRQRPEYVLADVQYVQFSRVFGPK